MLEKNLGNSFLLYLVARILQLVLEIRGFIKTFFWKNSQNHQTNTKSSHPDVFSQKMLLKVLKNSQKKYLYWSLRLETLHQSCRLETLHRQKQPLEMSVKQVVLNNVANFAGKKLCWSLFSIKLEFWVPETLLKKTLTHLFSWALGQFPWAIVPRKINPQLLVSRTIPPWAIASYANYPLDNYPQDNYPLCQLAPQTTPPLPFIQLQIPLREVSLVKQIIKPLFKGLYFLIYEV